MLVFTSKVLNGLGTDYRSCHFSPPCDTTAGVILQDAQAGSSPLVKLGRQPRFLVNDLQLQIPSLSITVAMRILDL